MIAYQPKWLRLSEARERIVSSLSKDEHEAEAWLMRAIQDQVRADPEGYAAQTMFRVQGFPTQWKRRRFPRDWPSRLTADRIDWDASTICGPDPEKLIWNDLFIEVSAEALDFSQPQEAEPVLNGSGVRKKKHVAAEEACGAWIKSLPKQPRQKRNDVLKTAREKFSALSDNAFDRQWGLYAPAEWKRQGRFD